jgi:hypothetical protein
MVRERIIAANKNCHVVKHGSFFMAIIIVMTNMTYCKEKRYFEVIKKGNEISLPFYTLQIVMMT